MASLQNVSFHIIRDTMTVGSICEVKYRYTLVCDRPEIENALDFCISARLCASHLFKDKPLGQSMYDYHRISALHFEQDFERSFVVPCEILNEDIGIDEIYMQLNLHSSSGADLIAETTAIREHF